MTISHLGLNFINHIRLSLRGQKEIEVDSDQYSFSIRRIAFWRVACLSTAHQMPRHEILNPLESWPSSFQTTFSLIFPLNCTSTYFTYDYQAADPFFQYIEAAERQLPYFVYNMRHSPLRSGPFSTTWWLRLTNGSDRSRGCYNG